MGSEVLVVRPAEAADAEAIGEAHAEAWRIAYVELFAPDVLSRAVEDRRSRWQSLFETDWFAFTTLLVVEVDDRVVGFAHFGPCADDPGLGEIYGFYLHPDAWGTSAATALMSNALQQLAARDHPGVCVWTHPGATRARAFYTKSGFRETGRTKREDMVDGPPVTEIEYIRPGN